METISNEALAAARAKLDAAESRRENILLFSHRQRREH